MVSRPKPLIIVRPLQFPVLAAGHLADHLYMHLRARRSADTHRSQ